MKRFLTIASVFLMILGASAQKSKLTKNGFYVESLIGSSKIENQETLFGGGIKLGNVWYFGSNENWKPGLKTVWFRGTTYFNDNDLLLQGSIANVGFANVFKFSEQIGLEANINFGYNFVYYKQEYENTYYDGSGYYYDNTESYDYTFGGILINPEVKFRFNVLAVGLDFAFSKLNEIDQDDNYNPKYGFSAINLSIGAKF